MKRGFDHVNPTQASREADRIEDTFAFLTGKNCQSFRSRSCPLPTNDPRRIFFLSVGGRHSIREGEI